MKLENTTAKRRVEPKRRYDDACGTAHALELIGERWALLVLRELMLGPRRFSDIKADLPGISANVLSQRLTDLEMRGLVVRRTLPPPASVQVYEATEWGLEAEAVLQALGRWAARSPGHDPALPISPVSVLLSLRTMFDPGKAGDIDLTLGLRFGDRDFIVRVGDGTLTVRPGAAPDCDARLSGTPEAFAGIVYAGLPLGAMQVEGDAALVRRFAALFELPPKAA